MNKLGLDLDKIITSFDEVQDVLDIIRSKMDDPRLESKNIIKKILSEEEMIEIMRLYQSKMKENIGEEQFKYVFGFSFSDKKVKNLFYMILKENFFKNFFITYFHELGHIAHSEFNKIQLPKLEKVVINEALAESFANWATEEFNKIYSPKFYDRKIVLYASVKNQDLEENLSKKTEERRILSRFLLDFYLVYPSTKKVYNLIQDLAYKNPENLADYISNK